MDKWWVYIIEKKSKLYVGLTTDLENRKRQHGVSGLLYTEGPFPKSVALARERQLKGWSRKKKLWLISECNACSAQHNTSLVVFPDYSQGYMTRVIPPRLPILYPAWLLLQR